MRKIINIYNFSKHLLTSSIKKHNKKIIQIIFMNQLWGYRMVWISFSLDCERKIEENYSNFILKITPLKLIDYKGNLITNINNYFNKQKN